MMNGPPPEVELWGLTGGIASGKSAAAQCLRELGLTVIDADQIAKTVALPGGRAAEAVQKAFGTLDRAELRKLIFSDSKKRKLLESILHPVIAEESFRQMQAAATRAGATSEHPLPVIYEAALLIEAGRAAQCKGVIVVTAPTEARLARLLERDAINHELGQKMIDAQLSDEERKASATDLLENLGTLQELQQKVIALARSKNWIS